jgi:cysteinyl-tRNA synthetase
MAKQVSRALRTTIVVGLLIATGCTSDNDVPDELPPDEPAAESTDARTTAPTADNRVTPTSDDRRRLLDDVEHWLYLIDVNLDADTVDRIVSSDHDMVVLDFIPSEQQNTDFPMGAVVDRLHSAEHDKLVLAYIDIGQAEDYRVYWEADWRIGDPEWIVANDPDGWEGNYPVAYWRPEWHDVWLGDDGLISQIVDAGFDGVYLDWVEAYSDDNVATAAALDDADPSNEMVDWVRALAETGRDGNPDFLVIGQNAAELAADSAEYRAVVDAVAQEQVWFDGAADNDPPGDCPLPPTDDLVDTEAYEATLDGACLQQYLEFPESTLHVSSEEYLISLDAIHATGLPVLTVDYASDPDNVKFVLETSREHGFVPFVGTRLLDAYIPPR